MFDSLRPTPGDKLCDRYSSRSAFDIIADLRARVGPEQYHNLLLVAGNDFLVHRIFSGLYDTLQIRIAAVAVVLDRRERLFVCQRSCAVSIKGARVFSIQAKRRPKPSAASTTRCSVATKQPSSAGMIYTSSSCSPIVLVPFSTDASM